MCAYKILVLKFLLGNTILGGNPVIKYFCKFEFSSFFFLKFDYAKFITYVNLRIVCNLAVCTIYM
jgi:hypothetical protein